MTIREQYKLAYSLLRSTQWDFRTFKIVCQINNVDSDARIRALISYNNSRLIDEIGEGYRNLSKDYAKIRNEVVLGYY